MGAAVKVLDAGEGALSPEMVVFADHLAELLAAEFVRALKEDNHESSDLREVLERKPTGAEHR